MKQKIEGGWEKEFDKKWDANSNWVDKDKTEEGGYVVFDKGKIKSFISDLLASDRQRIVNALFKPDHRYIVWLEGHELKVLDEASIKIK